MQHQVARSPLQTMTEITEQGTTTLSEDESNQDGLHKATLIEETIRQSDSSFLWDDGR